MTNETKRKSIINGKSIVLIILLFAVIAGFYMKISNDKKDVTNKVKDEYTILKEKDLDDAYPETPREVVKLYGRIAKCIYKEGLSDKKTEALVCQLRKLFDEELLKENPIESQLQELDYDLRTFHKAQKTIINYEVDKDSLVEATVDGVENASAVLSFSIKKDGKYTRTNELFLLRKDVSGKWKIVGWQLVDNKNNTDKNKDEVSDK